jgi:hypothetical protein
MRTLPAALAAELSKTTPVVGYFVEIVPVKTGVPYRLCSLRDARWNGLIWPAVGFNMPTPPAFDGNSAKTWSIAIAEWGNTFGKAVIRDGLNGARYRSWLAPLRNPALALGDVLAWTWGTMTESSVGSDTVEAQVTTELITASMTPRQRIYKPIYNFPPPLNSTVEWGGGVIQITDGVST